MKRKLKYVITRILKGIAVIIYRAVCFMFPVNSRRVVFMTPRHDLLKDNLRYLYVEMKEAKPELEYVIVTRRRNTGKVNRLNGIRDTLKVYYYLATARTFILDDYYLPLYFIKVRKGTEVVQLWHASGPLKKVGLSLRGLPDGPNESYIKVVQIHSNYDKIIVNSSGEIDFYAEAFGMPQDNILALGSPRTDVLFRNVEDETKKAAFVNDHPQFKDKELILYAPTFRGRSNDPKPYVPQLDMENMIPLLLKNDKVLIFNLHPYMNENEDLIKQMDGRVVYWNEAGYPIEDLLMISDALISDYSSVVYDFAILEKPIALYCYDCEQYNRQRGFYVDIKQLLPETYFEQEGDLLNWIMSDSKSSSEVIQLKNKNFKHKDGQASKRIIKSIFQ